MTVSAFRVVLTASWALTAVGNVVDTLLEPTLPEVLRNYMSQQSETDVPAGAIVTLVVGVIGVLAMLVSYVGLHFWKPWARTLFLVSVVTTYLAGLFFQEPLVITPLSMFLWGVAEVTVGIVIAAIYFVEPIRSKFNPTAKAE